ncbi:MAG: hypothetical protein ABH834_05475 [Candidatus Altiarchaeota archaeon]
MLVGYFVLEEVDALLEDSAALSVMLAKFRVRYPDDVEFGRLCELYDEYRGSYDPRVFEEFKSHLGGLLKSRSSQSGGGGGLPFSDRRSMREDRSRR